RRGLDAQLGGRLGHRGEQVVGYLVDVERLLVLGVGDAVAAAEVELRQDHAELVVDARVQLQDAVGGGGEALRVEDLRADVAVQANELEVRGLHRGLGGAVGRTGCQRE